MSNLEKNVLVFVAHPDDETIGMGGTIKRHINSGDNVYVVSMTNGLGSREKISEVDIRNRNISAEEAEEILGFKWYERFDFSDNQMDKYPLLDFIKLIEKTKKEILPQIVYTHSPSDLNIDHRIVSESVLTAFRPQPNEICREIRLFEVPSATDYGNIAITGNFVPNLFINIYETWESKLSSLKSYGKELKEYPHTRSLESIKNLAKLRGNQVGLEMAEAFQIIRKIEK